MNTRLIKADRCDAILAAALKLAERDNYKQIRREAISEKAGCSPALVTYHFSTLNQLKRAVMRYAITKENLRVIAQGLVDQNPHALKAPPELRTRALAALSA